MTPWAGDWAYFRTLHDWLPEPFFQTSGFLAFAGLTLAIYWCIPRRWNTARVAVLVIASLHFYAAWNAGAGAAGARYICRRLSAGPISRKRNAMPKAIVIHQHWHEPWRARLLQVPRLLSE